MNFNHIIRLFIVILTLSTVTITYGQNNPVLYLNFNDTDQDNSQVKVLLNDKYDYDKGLKGKALNLSASSTYRYPVEVEKNPLLEPSTDKSFTVLIWVKMKHGRISDNVIISNKRIPHDRGWMIRSNSYGSWEWNICDGDKYYSYASVHDRQPIDDNKWHQLGFTLDRDKDEARLYYDGQCYAVYALSYLESITGSNVWIGGYGINETFSFPGWIDAVQINNSVLTEKEINNQFKELLGKTDSNTIEEEAIANINIVAFNIQNGGIETGNTVGIERVTDVIRIIDPDIAVLSDNFGSANIIADELDYYLYNLSDNIAILSRYKFGETFKIFETYNCGAIEIIPNSLQRFVVCGANLNSLPETNYLLAYPDNTTKVLSIENKTRKKQIDIILENMQPLLQQCDSIPVIFAGSLYSGSHLDWIEPVKRLHNGYVMKWPVTMSIQDAGLVDSFREINTDPNEEPGITFPIESTGNTIADRTDYIFYKGKKIKAEKSEVTDSHPVKWPSNHNLVATFFHFDVPPELKLKINPYEKYEGMEFEDFINAYFTEDTTYKDFSSERVFAAKTDFSKKKDTTSLILANGEHIYTHPFNGKITSRYGFRRWRMHYGTDIDLEKGDSVACAFDGKVRIASFRRGYGYTIVVRHLNGLETLYGHLSKLLVREAEVVNSGQVIGLGGNTGRSRGSHLHFETRYQGTAFNTEKIIDYESGTLKSDTLYVCKELFGFTGKDNKSVPQTTKSSVYHTVRKGDTLGAIAKRYGTTVSTICRLNNISSKTLLQLNKRLRVR